MIKHSICFKHTFLDVNLIEYGGIYVEVYLNEFITLYI